MGVLSPHFCCESFTYGGYRILGFLRNCVSLEVIALGAPVVAAIMWYVSLPAGAIMLAIVLVIASFRAKAKRDAKVMEFTTAYDSATKAHNDRRPHAIAHSFGTYLLCAGLAKYPEVTFDRLIFWGSVVTRRFDWSSYARKRAFRRVQNEISRRDYVPMIARLAVWIPLMGDSGRKGFRSRSAAVRNVPFPSFGHSDAVELRKHILETWLPFFWGIPPNEYRLLLDLCEECLREAGQDTVETRVESERFDRARWSWAGPRGKGGTFEQLLRAQLEQFCASHNCAWIIGTPDFSICYAMSRRMFWDIVRPARRPPADYSRRGGPAGARNIRRLS